MRVCVVGLGYVGLPLAVAFSKKYSVIGIDLDKKKVQMVNSGKNYLKECPYLDEELKRVVEEGKLRAFSNIANGKDAKAFVVCVNTPIREDKTFDMAPLEGAIEAISAVLKRGDLVVIETTVAPGTTRNLARKLEKLTGLEAGTDFFMAHSPERIDPGSKWRVEKIPKLVGGINEESTKRAKELYEGVIEKVVPVSSSEVSEAAKLLENSFRAINIGFVNEFAQFCQIFGIDVKEVIEAASTKPFGFMPFYPSLGVGGACIPKDSWFLINLGRKKRFYFDFLTLAMRINDEMPHFTLNLLRDALEVHGLSLRGAKIAIFGVAYKRNTGDVRESPSLKLAKELLKRGATVNFYDPFVESVEVGGLQFKVEKDPEIAVNGAHALVIGTDHDEFKNLDFGKLSNLMSERIVIDGKNMLERERMEKLGFYYVGIGRPPSTASR